MLLVIDKIKRTLIVEGDFCKFLRKKLLRIFTL
jgi:hypothetical protein